MPLFDFHAHFPMHLPFPPRRSDDEIADAIKGLELDVANALLNYRASIRPAPRATLPLAHAGNLKGFCSVLYDPDDEFFRSPQPRPEAFANLLAQMDEVEKAVAADPQAEIARSAADLDRILGESRVAVIHCVEGGHGLGGDPANVARLRARGVVYLIVAHLFYRGAATCVNAFPDLDDALFHLINPQPDGVGLTQLGRDVVEAALGSGMVVDITHCTDQAAADVFKIAQHYPGCPVISSHNGVRATSSYALNLSDDTIRQIAGRGGLIGVILSSHWLRQPDEDTDGVGLVLRAIDHIHDVTGSHAFTAIGTDLDGFITPVARIDDFSRIPFLEQALCDRYGDDAEQIISGNVLRFLRRQWGS